MPQFSQRPSGLPGPAVPGPPDRLLAVAAVPLALRHLRIGHHGGRRVPVGHPGHLDQAARRSGGPTWTRDRLLRLRALLRAGHRPGTGHAAPTPVSRAVAAQLGGVAHGQLGRLGLRCGFPAGQPGAQRAAVRWRSCWPASIRRRGAASGRRPGCGQVRQLGRPGCAACRPSPRGAGRRHGGRRRGSGQRGRRLGRTGTLRRDRTGTRSLGRHSAGTGALHGKATRIGGPALLALRREGTGTRCPGGETAGVR